MRAIVVDPDSPARLGFRNVPEPTPLPSEAVVRLAAVSLNLGEVRRAQSAVAGFRPGWDIAGTVESAAADGSGPPAGTRVVGMLPSGAWAERVAVPTHALATLPDAVDFARAATLPIAGLTALYALAHGGLLLAKRVLITGASGGVGHLACQLAHAAGADVVALVRSEAKAGDALRGERSVTVVASEDGSGAVSHGPFDLILESVGGATLANVLRAIAEDGECVVFGTSAQGESTLDIRSFYGLGGAKLYGFILFHELQREPAGKGLARLVKLVERGVLRPHIDVERSWSELPRTAAQLWDREITGKAVLRFDG